MKVLTCLLLLCTNAINGYKANQIATVDQRGFWSFVECAGGDLLANGSVRAVGGLEARGLLSEIGEDTNLVPSVSHLSSLISSRSLQGAVR